MAPTHPRGCCSCYILSGIDFQSIYIAAVAAFNVNVNVNTELCKSSFPQELGICKYADLQQLYLAEEQLRAPIIKSID